MPHKIVKEDYTSTNTLVENYGEVKKYDEGSWKGYKK